MSIASRVNEIGIFVRKCALQLTIRNDRQRCRTTQRLRFDSPWCTSDYTANAAGQGLICLAPQENEHAIRDLIGIGQIIDQRSLWYLLARDMVETIDHYHGRLTIVFPVFM